MRFLVAQPFVLVDEGVAVEYALLRHTLRDRHPAFVLHAFVAFSRARCALFTPKISHARDYTGIAFPIPRGTQPLLWAYEKVRRPSVVSGTAAWFS